MGTASSAQKKESQTGSLRLHRPTRPLMRARVHSLNHEAFTRANAKSNVGAKPTQANSASSITLMENSGQITVNPTGWKSMNTSKGKPLHLLEKPNFNSLDVGQRPRLQKTSGSSNTHSSKPSLFHGWEAIVDRVESQESFHDLQDGDKRKDRFASEESLTRKSTLKSNIDLKGATQSFYVPPLPLPEVRTEQKGEAEEAPPPLSFTVRESPDELTTNEKGIPPRDREEDDIPSLLEESPSSESKSAEIESQSSLGRRDSLDSRTTNERGIPPRGCDGEGGNWSSFLDEVFVPSEFKPLEL